MRLNLTLFVLSVLSLLLSSCKKDNEKSDSQISTIEEKFFAIPVDAPVTVKRVADIIRFQNARNKFIDKLVEKEGYILWDKAIVQSSSNESIR